MSCLPSCAGFSREFWASHPPTGTIPISGAPSQSLAGASFRAFEPKRGWQLRSALPAEDDFFSREAPSHRHRDGRLAQSARAQLVSLRSHVNFHPYFWHRGHSICRAVRAAIGGNLKSQQSSVHTLNAASSVAGGAGQKACQKGGAQPSLVAKGHRVPRGLCNAISVACQLRKKAAAAEVGRLGVWTNPGRIM